MHPGYLWVSPFTLGLLALVLGLLTQAGLRITGNKASLAAVLVPGICLGWLNSLHLFVPGLHVGGWLLLGGGLAAATKRCIDAKPQLYAQLVRRTTWCLVIGLAGVAGWQTWQQTRQEDAALATIPAEIKDRPNILLMVLDTVRADALAAVGNDPVLAPHLAELASQGVQFRNASATAPWTLPSQAGMFTGRLPHELSADWWSRLDARHPTLAEELSRRGWVTGGFVGNTRYCSSETGLSRGFTHYEAYRLSWADCLLTTAVGRKMLLSPLPLYVGCNDWPGRKRAGEINRAFLDWLTQKDRRGDERPYFAFLNYWDAHDPYIAPAEFRTRPAAGGQDKRLVRDWWWTHKEDVTPTQVAMLRSAYEDCIRGLDHECGQLLQSLEADGKLANTIIVITADHGEHFGDHELYLHGNSLYDALLHVPLIVSWPAKLPAGLTIDTPVSLQDLPQTLMDLAVGAGSFPGSSWKPHWESPAEHRQAPIIAEIASQAGFPPCHGRSPVAAGPMQCIREGNLKYIRNALGTEQLFDLSQDPGETRNLANDADYADAKQRLQTALRRANPDAREFAWPTVEPAVQEEE